ncbi:polysaccharide biosynthesis protein [Flavobacteriaceae bacterium]|nr:polysaccharide biosynthesis protein [Flavobacteriaceae bacterium]
MNDALNIHWNAKSRQPYERRLPNTVSQFFAGKNILITGSSGFLAQQIIQRLQNDVPDHGDLIGIDIVSLNGSEDADPVPVPRKGVSANTETDQFVFYQGYCGDSQLLKTIFAQHRIDFVIHCAAQKYLPKLQNDPYRALKENTLESIMFLEFCLEAKVPNILYVSTDKATEPISIYGVSKLFPERFLAAKSKSFPKSNISCIRLGNIFGSSGSVLKQWDDQWSASNSIIIRGKAMQRIFVSPSQAAVYCLISLFASNELQETHSEGLLRFGPAQADSWSIYELAQHWLKLKGVSNPETHIQNTPALAGEKTSERIWSTLDTPLKSSFEELSFICDRPNSDYNLDGQAGTAIDKAIARLKQIVANAESNAVGQGFSEKTQKQSLEWIKDNVFDLR